MPSINTALVDVHVFCRENGRTLYLLMHRALGKRYAGLWRMVAGKVEPGELPLQAALRELTEETGLTAQAIWALDYLHTYYDPQQDTLNLIPVFAVEVTSCQQLTLSDEHDAARWIMYDQALEMLRWPGQREGLRRTHEDIVISPDRGVPFSVTPDA